MYSSYFLTHFKHAFHLTLSTKKNLHPLYKRIYPVYKNVYILYTERNLVTSVAATKQPWATYIIYTNYLYVCVCVCACVHVCICVCAQSLKLCTTLCDPWTGAHQAPLSKGFSRQGYWSGSPLPPPAHLLMPGVESTSPLSPALTGGFSTTAPYICIYTAYPGDTVHLQQTWYTRMTNECF